MKRFLTWLSAVIIRTLGWSLRVRAVDHGGILGHPEHEPVIIAFWHNRIVTAAIFWERYCRPRRGLTFISRSRDGEFMSNVAAHFGITPARGSSSKHGISAALAAMHASSDEKLDLVITPDGPRGPKYQIQPGILRLAQTTGRPIVTVTTRLKWKWVLKSWDGFQVPLPLSICELETGPPVMVPEDATEEELEAIKVRLGALMGND
jgi:lysophospholipid acyltransferase (LPLAT)-like uncharacterized protein